jgi:hypothetical protein
MSLFHIREKFFINIYYQKTPFSVYILNLILFIYLFILERKHEEHEDRTITRTSFLYNRVSWEKKFNGFILSFLEQGRLESNIFQANKHDIKSAHLVTNLIVKYL